MSSKSGSNAINSKTTVKGLAGQEDQVLKQTTRDFIQALKAMPQYQSFAKAQADYDQDAEARQLVIDFQEAQQTFNIFRQGEISGITEQKERLVQLHSKLQHNIKITTLQESQKQLEHLISGLANHISQEIEFPFNQHPASGGCCG